MGIKLKTYSHFRDLQSEFRSVYHDIIKDINKVNLVNKGRNLIIVLVLVLIVSLINDNL